MAIPTDFKPLSALSERVPEVTDYLYLINNAGTAEGKALLSALQSLAGSPTFARSTGVGQLTVGSSYLFSGASSRDLPAIVADGVSITGVRKDDATSFTLNPTGGDTVADDSSLLVDVDNTEFKLVANLATKNWEVH